MEALEPIPTICPTVNRTAIVVGHKEPFVDWLVALDAENSEIDLQEDLNCYLVPDFEEFDELQDYLKSQYDNIFRNELNDWYTDSESWPQNRTFEMFREWFSLTVHVMVHDLTEIPLERDPIEDDD